MPVRTHVHWESRGGTATLGRYRGDTGKGRSECAVGRLGSHIGRRERIMGSSLGVGKNQLREGGGEETEMGLGGRTHGTPGSRRRVPEPCLTRGRSSREGGPRVGQYLGMWHCRRREGIQSECPRGRPETGPVVVLKETIPHGVRRE